jgi:hypothetical protein
VKEKIYPAMKENLMTCGMYLNHDMLSRVGLLPAILFDCGVLQFDFWYKQ